ncbi:hypothetical protein [Nostoc sp. NMS4]|uniref:hypothetical protein n=1 Tax=Nostoc sp. NMS4 TaxID=2815390 RepID=UPI0025FAB858|nr:hypothetical protein [Nostoc sp. NMS4]MBN3924211.1 hypothetical protein [Nostoc sp. NMS4]
MLGGENNFFRWQYRDDNQLEVIQLIDAINPDTSLLSWYYLRPLAVLILVKVYTVSQHDLLKQRPISWQVTDILDL